MKGTRETARNIAPTHFEGSIRRARAALSVQLASSAACVATPGGINSSCVCLRLELPRRWGAQAQEAVRGVTSRSDCCAWGSGRHAGDAPLHVAVRSGEMDAARVLLETPRTGASASEIYEWNSAPGSAMDGLMALAGMGE